MLREAKYVNAVYKSGSFSKAAASMFISQPSLSATIRRLENELGTTLFDRSTNPITLTDAGRQYILYAEKYLALENEAKNYFESLKNSDQGHLNFTTTSFYCCYSLPIYLNPFRSQYPHININLSENTISEEMIKSLRLGHTDFALSSNPVGFEEFKKLFFLKEQLILAIPGSWEINETLKEFQLSFEDILDGRQRSYTCPRVSLEYFKDLPFLSLREGNDLYSRSLELFDHVGSVPKVYMYLDQIPTAYHLVSYGYGFTLIRDTTLHVVPQPSENDKNQVVFYKIDDDLAIRNIYFYYQNSLTITPAQEAFIKYTRYHCGRGE